MAQTKLQTKLTNVRIMKRFAGYNQGEIAGFAGEELEQLLASGAVALVQPPARKAPAPPARAASSKSAPLPSAVDLDAVAAEQKVAGATGETGK
jgi:hypothetical protein